MAPRKLLISLVALCIPVAGAAALSRQDNLSVTIGEPPGLSLSSVPIEDRVALAQLQLSQTTQEYEQAQRQLSDSEAAYKTAAAKNAKLPGEIESLQKQIPQIQAQIDAAAADLVSLQSIQSREELLLPRKLEAARRVVSDKRDSMLASAYADLERARGERIALRQKYAQAPQDQEEAQTMSRRKRLARSNADAYYVSAIVQGEASARTAFETAERRVAECRGRNAELSDAKANAERALQTAIAELSLAKDGLSEYHDNAERLSARVVELRIRKNECESLALLAGRELERHKERLDREAAAQKALAQRQSQAASRNAVAESASVGGWTSANAKTDSYRNSDWSSSNRRTTSRYPVFAENGDWRGIDNDGDGRAEGVHVQGYHRKDGTYVRSHYRARPGR